MKPAISVHPTPTSLTLRFVFPAIAASLLVICPNRLLAQAPTPAGQQGDSAGTKPEHHKTPQEVEQAFRNAKGRKEKKSPKIRNTHAAVDPQIAAMLAELQQLQAELQKMKASAASGGGDKSGGNKGTPPGQTTNAGGSPPTGTSGSKSSGGTPPAGGPTPPGATPGGSGHGNPPGTPGTPAGGGAPSGGAVSVAMVRAPMAVAPATVPASSGSTPPASTATRSIAAGGGVAMSSVSIAAACATKILMIQNVNGVATGASNSRIVFSQDPQYDDYKLTGCNFGQTTGQAHLNGPFKSGQIAMQIESWTDTAIEMKVPPNLTGETDLSNVTLVIAPASGPQGQLQGCQFYALRQEVALASFPQSQVTLGSVVDTAGATVTGKFTSPYATESGFPGGVDRYDVARFGPGTDVWDLSTLAAGFVPTQFSLSHWALDMCYGGGITVSDETVYNDGSWGAQWDPSNPKHLIVNFAEQHCHEYGGADSSNSSYALVIQVSGPIGVNPWP